MPGGSVKIAAMATQLSTRRPCINTRTKHFHFSVGFDPDTGQPVEFFITGRGKVGQELDFELYELSVEASKRLCQRKAALTAIQ